MTSAGHQAGERRRWPFYLVGVVVAAGCAVAGVLLAASRQSSHGHHHGPVFVTVFAVVIAVVAAAAVLWSLRREFNQPAMRALRGYSFAQRRATMRAANRGDRLTREQRTVAQAQLEQLRSSARRVRLFLPLAVVAFAVLAVADTGGLRWLWAALALVELVSVAASIVLIRRQSAHLTAALAQPETGR